MNSHDSEELPPTSETCIAGCREEFEKWAETKSEQPIAWRAAQWEGWQAAFDFILEPFMEIAKQHSGQPLVPEEHKADKPRLGPCNGCGELNRIGNMYPVRENLYCRKCNDERDHLMASLSTVQ